MRPLFPLVQAVAAGSPAPADVEMTWQCHFIDAYAGVVLVPFTLDFTHDTFDAFPLALYVRVVMRGAQAPAPGPTDALAQYPFEDAAIVDGPLQARRISRAFTAPPGAYDVYVAVAEPTRADGTRGKTSVIKQEVTIPDLKSGLTTSSIIVAERVQVDEQTARATYEDQLDDPYRLWGNRITPATRRTFRQNETLSLLFLVYQARAGADGKPDVEVSYRVTGGPVGKGDTLQVRVSPEVFNAASLPAGFSLTNGDLVLAGRQIPLATFPAGAYRVDIGVTDKLAGASVRRVLAFSVVDAAKP